MTTIRPEHLEAAIAEGIVTREQALRLSAFLAAREGEGGRGGPRFTFVNALHHLGGMLAIGAMSLFMTLGWDAFGGFAVAGLALAYLVLAVALALWFERRGLDVPMGLMAVLAVVLVPLGTWGVQHALGFWADATTIRGYRDYHHVIDWRWLFLELATLVAGAAILFRFRAPFLLMPIAVTLWYMSMDLAIFLIGPDAKPWGEDEWIFRKWFSLAFGLIVLLGAFWVDLRTRTARDYAFWLYLFGLLTAWVALTSMDSHSLAGKLVYLAINVGLVLMGAVLARRTFTVFGAIGVAIALGSISWTYFRNSWLFPILLTAIGLAIIALAVWWSRHEARLTQRLQGVLPEDLRTLLATRRAQAA